MSSLPQVPFLGLRLAACTTAEMIQWTVLAARTRKRPCRVSYLNAANVNLAYASPEAARLLESADCLYADGQSIVWASRRLGHPIPERINAGDFTEEFFTACAQAQLKIALIGGKPGEAEGFADHFRGRVAGLEINFIHHGYFESNTADALADRIESADPDLVMLGMGAPRQDRYAQAWSQRGRPRVWWSVGALFEYASGTRRRAPVLIRRLGLEWAFRLALEPRRLGRRYLIGNPRFIYRVFKSSPITLGEGSAVDSAATGSASSPSEPEP